MLPVSGVFGERVLIYMLTVPVWKLCNGLSRFYIQFYHGLFMLFCFHCSGRGSVVFRRVIRSNANFFFCSCLVGSVISVKHAILDNPFNSFIMTFSFLH